jgi:hypothetical protein
MMLRRIDKISHSILFGVICFIWWPLSILCSWDQHTQGKVILAGGWRWLNSKNTACIFSGFQPRLLLHQLHVLGQLLPSLSLISNDAHLFLSTIPNKVTLRVIFNGKRHAKVLYKLKSIAQKLMIRNQVIWTGELRAGVSLLGTRSRQWTQTCVKYYPGPLCQIQTQDSS